MEYQTLAKSRLFWMAEFFNLKANYRSYILFLFRANYFSVCPNAINKRYRRYEGVNQNGRNPFKIRL